MTPQRDRSVVHLQVEVPATTALTFQALTDPSMLRDWWGPDGFSTPGIDLDLRPGGHYRFVMQPPDGAPFHLSGEFQAIEPEQRLVYTFCWEEPDPDDVTTLVSVTLADRDRSTLLTVDHRGFTTEARRALHEQGWTESLRRLEELLRRGPTPGG